LEDRERIADSEEVGDPTFEMPGTRSDDTQPLVRPVDLEPLDSAVPEFVAPPEMMGNSPLPDPFDDEEEEAQEEELPPLEAAELALAELRAEAAALSERLDSQSQTLMARNRRAVLSSALFIILVAIYMVWAGAQLKVAFRPESVADAATGVARDAIPQAASALHLMLEDGAADIAESFGEDLVRATPGYREALVQDLDPALAALSAVVVERMYKEILQTSVADYAETEAGPERSRALEAMLSDLDLRLSTSLEDRGVAAQVAAVQAQPSLTNRALRIRQTGRQENHDRELLLMWLTVIAGR
jgi:hypothetical protein